MIRGESADEMLGSAGTYAVAALSGIADTAAAVDGRERGVLAPSLSKLFLGQLASALIEGAEGFIGWDCADKLIVVPGTFRL